MTVQGDWEPAPKDSKTGAIENCESLSKLPEPLVSLQDTAQPHKLFPQITTETACSLWGDARTRQTVLNFILAKQCRTICRWYNTPYYPSDKRSRGEWMNNFCAEPSPVRLHLGWIHNIYNGMEQRRSTALVRRSTAVSQPLWFLPLKKKKHVWKCLTFIFSFFICTKWLLALLCMHWSTSNCPHSTSIVS